MAEDLLLLLLLPMVVVEERGERLSDDCEVSVCNTKEHGGCAIRLGDGARAGVLT
jgi:hypothetical protein